tara:strand:+ start:266 stop:472 length:207 start_codon:yes stop_codon:yes gene_type:complete
MKAEQILIELLDKLRDDVAEMNGYICSETGHNGYADERAYAEVTVSESIIKWIKERVEVKKTLTIKEK